MCYLLTDLYTYPLTYSPGTHTGLAKQTRNPAIAEGPRDAGVPVEIW